MPLSRKLLKELNDLADAVGWEGIRAAAAEAESKLPKRGRKKGPVYKIEEAVSRMRELRAAAPARSWHEIAKQAGREFNISWQTLRKEERKRRQSIPPEASAPAPPPPKPEDSQPKQSGRRRVIPSTPDYSRADAAALLSLAGISREDLARGFAHLAPFAEDAQKAMANWLATHRAEMERIQEGQRMFLKDYEIAIAEARANQKRIIGELTRHPNWRDILDGLGGPGKK